MAAVIVQKDEFLEIKETYGDERRTEIIDAVDEVPRLMGDLAAHRHDPPAHRLPPLVMLIRRQLPFRILRGDHEIDLRFEMIIFLALHRANS